MTYPANVPTLNDVARVAGVSTATVSRCLNAPERVLETTRRKVLDAVSELGYTPNFAARVMAAKRSNTIGAIIPTMENAIFARGLQAFQEELLVHGYTLLVASSSYRPDIERTQIRTLVSRGADGLLLIGHDRDPEVLRFLEMRGVPAVAAWTSEKGHALPSVGFQNRASMRALAELVIAKGHRNIAVISAKRESNDRARQRVEGILDAVRNASLDPSDVQVIETTYGIETGGQAFAHLMDAPRRPTVVMCGNDVLAVGALKMARSLGIGIPDDVSVTGFDDIELARVVVPELTTVHVPHREMGRLAARNLIRMVEGDLSDRSVELAAETRLRGSLAPPRPDTGTEEVPPNR